MNLSEHPDFVQAILNAAEHFRSRGLRASLIEKDYFVTESLRIIQRESGSKVIFKGGTSLSKGWNLIHRFSEDIDIFLDPAAFSPTLGKHAIDRELKRLRDAIGKHRALSFRPDESQTIGGFGRKDYFEYETRLEGVADVANRVLVESGTASGREPTEEMQIDSYLAQFLREVNVSLGADDEQPFAMRLLHFRRTFVEKLFAIHAKVEAFKQQGIAIGSYARHYYDLYCLVATPEVQAMLRSDEYQSIKDDYNRVSTKHFPKSYTPPPGLKFSDSEALFPPEDLGNRLASELESQCKVLCFGPYPSWEELRFRFDGIRQAL